MSYYIEYPGSAPLPCRTGLSSARILLMAIPICICFLGTVCRIWPDAARVLDTFKTQIVPPIPKDALETMVLQLRTGTSLEDALTAFCRDVVQRGLIFAA